MDPNNIKDEINLGVQEYLVKVSQSFRGLPFWQRVILIAFIIGTIPGYYLVRGITQFGFEQGYKDFLVTAQQLAVAPKPVAINNTTILPVGDNHYAVYAEIENLNLDLSLSGARYLIELKNGSNDTVGRSNGSFYLLPGQKKYLVDARVAGQGSASTAVITFVNEVWQRRLDIPTVSFTATEPNRFVQPDPLAYVVEGDIINSSPFILKQVSVNVLLFDASGKIVAVSRREEFDLSPRTRRTYKLLWPGTTGGNFARAEVQVDTNTLDANNLRVVGAESNNPTGFPLEPE